MKKQHQNIPLLFREIISHQAVLAELLSREAVPFKETTEAIARNRELMRAAEVALQWNHNKGATA